MYPNIIIWVNLFIFWGLQHSAVFQSQRQDVASESTACEDNPETDQEPR